LVIEPSLRREARFSVSIEMGISFGKSSAYGEERALKKCDISEIVVKRCGYSPLEGYLSVSIALNLLVRRVAKAIQWTGRSCYGSKPGDQKSLKG
jgi:hypothetical protein